MSLPTSTASGSPWTPVAILLIAVLHFVPDEDDPYEVVARLMDAIPSGSYLVIGHWAGDIQSDQAAEATRRYNERSPVPITPRNREQIARFFDALELTDRGLRPISQWFGAGQVEVAAHGLADWCGIARKP